MAQEIYLIDDGNELKNKLTELFKKEKDYKFKKAKTTDIETVLKNIPALIIINEDGIQENIIKLCDKIRANEDNSITPIIVISSITEKQHRVQILQACVEHYIKAPIDEEYLYYTVKNVIRLLDTNRRVSPLTGLPGNVQIQAEIKKRLLNNEQFSILYIDLDNFKAYNENDNVRFAKEYADSQVGEDNVFVYKNIDEIINILKYGTGVVFWALNEGFD